MGSSWALVSATALVFVLLSSAFEDGQHDITFEPDEFSDGVMQRPIDWRELFDPKDFQTEQVIVSPPDIGGSRQEGWTPRGRPSGVGPRSYSFPLDYDVQFPLARPTSDNLQAICLHGDHRPRYPSSYFPDSGFSKQKRKADAVNNAELWFSTCCKRNLTLEQDEALCCATQAWKQSVDVFCQEDTSVKDLVYHCCKLTGNRRENCFHTDAQNKNYEPTEELPVSPVPSTVEFFFDPDSCQRTVMTPRNVNFYRTKKDKNPPASQETHINFPLGRPTADNIESVCQNQKLRPLYNVKCLPGSRHNVLARKAKTINRIEKGFKKCCKKKKDVLDCADKKWREEMNKFCMVNRGEQVDSPCCVGDQFTCFQSISPDPHYDKTSAPEDLSLNNICDTHPVIKKRFPVGFPLKTFVNQCCPLPEQDRTSCSAEQVKVLSASLCLPGKASSPAVRHCCDMPSQEIPQCISKILMDAITKASNASRQKKRKRCPLS